MDLLSESELPLTSPSSSTRKLKKLSKTKVKRWIGIIPVLIGIAIPILVPVIQMNIFYRLWGSAKHNVPKEQCTCSCWDTIFKGPYESGIGRYKHFYFNSTSNTMKIWILVVFGIIIAFECCKKLLKLLVNGRLRWSMGLLFLSSIHSHYYAWWAVINYLNDEFYDQWNHQLFFTITELIATFIVIRFLDSKKSLISPIPILIICNIAFIHILTACSDQFIQNIIFGEGMIHQVLRDLLFMWTDILYLVIGIYELNRYAKSRGERIRDVVLQKTNLYILGGLTFGMLFCIHVILR